MKITDVVEYGKSIESEVEHFLEYEDVSYVRISKKGAPDFYMYSDQDGFVSPELSNKLEDLFQKII